MEKLTEKEKKFAEDNHNLIYKYLREHGYSIEEHYSTAVFGYLTAVQAYHRKEKLNGNYNFSYIAYQYMRAEFSNQRKHDNAKKRIPMENIQSLDEEYEESENLYNCILGGKSAEDEVIDSERMTELLEILSAIQRKIISLRMGGFSNKEILLILEIKPSTYYKELCRIKEVFGNVLM